MYVYVYIYIYIYITAGEGGVFEHGGGAREQLPAQSRKSGSAAGHTGECACELNLYAPH
jgi:hypothetical protein